MVLLYHFYSCFFRYFVNCKVVFHNYLLKKRLHLQIKSPFYARKRGRRSSVKIFFEQQTGGVFKIIIFY
nr:MAG TPA: hypothetical protein [Caudoviricetes sp.]